MNGKPVVIKLPKSRVQNTGNPFVDFRPEILLATRIVDVNKPADPIVNFPLNYYRPPAMICFPKKAAVAKPRRPYCRP